jgi:hypothetical protein
MRIEIEIGDIVKVTDNGYQYTTYVEMAVRLGADVSSYIMRLWNENQGSFRDLDSSKARKDRSCKWIYDNVVDNGDVCVTLNTYGSIALIERAYDCRQFIISFDGLKIEKKSQMFSDMDFLL